MARRMVKLMIIPVFLTALSIIVVLYSGVSIPSLSAWNPRGSSNNNHPAITSLAGLNARTISTEAITFVNHFTDQLPDDSQISSTPVVDTSEEINRQPSNVSMETRSVTGLSLEREHELRRRHLRDTCLNVRAFRPAFRLYSPQRGFYMSKKYGFAFCKVPKSGSTFWMQLFLLLEKGPSFAQHIFNIPRSDIHARAKRLISSERLIFKDRVPLVLVARNPFSRIYSAFVDKVFLPLFWEQLQDIPSVSKGEPFEETVTQTNGTQTLSAKTTFTPICANNVTFEDFLKFILNQTMNRKGIEPHWAPISALCRPCLLNTHIIIKQESFTTDVEFALSNLTIEPSISSVLTKAMTDHRAESSIPGILAVLASKMSSKRIRPCLSPMEASRRLWESLKIQGFLNNFIPFPKEFFKDLRGDVFPKGLLKELLLDTVRENPMSAESRERQRNSYLVQAYKGVSPEVIRQIQEMYKSDFMLFNYSMEPPS